MAYVITSACIDVKDKSCISVCPVDCIYFEEQDRMCFIHPEECIDCGVCVEACPVAAIFPEKDITSESKPFIAINALWFENKDEARQKADALAGPGK